MNDKDKVYFIKLVLAVVILIFLGAMLGAAGYLAKNRTAKVGQPQVSLVAKPMILSDKASYNQGEVIKITLKNNSDKSIFYNKIATCGLYFEEIQKKENTSWMGTIWNFPCLKMWEGYSEIIELKPGQEDSITRKYNIGEKYIGPGVFRFSFKYGAAKENPEENIIYSNEITVNEKTIDYNLRDISQWKIFRENRLDFEFHYPEPIKNIRGIAFSSGYFLNIDLNTLTENVVTPLQNNKFDMSIKNYDKKDTDVLKRGLVENSEKQIQIDRLNGIQFKAMEISPYIDQITIFEKNNKLYVFKGEGEFFDAMLSTFKFGQIDSQLTDFSNRVKYKNEKYGIELEYPDYLDIIRENDAEIRFSYGHGSIVISPISLMVEENKINDYKCDVGKTQKLGILPNIITKTCDKIKSENGWEVYKIISSNRHSGEINYIYNLLKKKQDNNFTVFVISASELSEDKMVSTFKFTNR